MKSADSSPAAAIYPCLVDAEITLCLLTIAAAARASWLAAIERLSFTIIIGSMNAVKP